MTLFILSFIAGVLTVAAPCVLPMLPVIIGGSLVEGGKEKAQKQWLPPLIIAISLAVSVILFSLLIKSTTALLGIPQIVWKLISGVIVLLLGINYLKPTLWEKLSAKLSIRSNLLLGKASSLKGHSRSVVLGVALGPVFNSCSPTYALIVAVVIPVSFLKGLIYLSVYAVGMSATLLVIAYLGQGAAKKMKWLSNPNGLFKKVVAVLLIIVGLSVIFGLDKRAQTYVLEHGWYNPISNLEQRLNR